MLYETDLVKYFRIQIGKNLTWKQKITHVVTNLNKANAMLCKLKNVLDEEL